jgi:hypothetical protein
MTTIVNASIENYAMMEKLGIRRVYVVYHCLMKLPVQLDVMVKHIS